MGCPATSATEVRTPNIRVKSTEFEVLTGGDGGLVTIRCRDECGVEIMRVNDSTVPSPAATEIMTQNQELFEKAEAKLHVKMLHRWGIRSRHAYPAGVVARGLSVIISIFMSSESRGARVGAVLAPTLLIIGLGLKPEEDERTRRT